MTSWQISISLFHNSWHFLEVWCLEVSHFLHKPLHPEAVFGSGQQVDGLMTMTSSQHFLEQILVNKYVHEDVGSSERREGHVIGTKYTMVLLNSCTLCKDVLLWLVQ